MALFVMLFTSAVSLPLRSAAYRSSYKTASNRIKLIKAKSQAIYKLTKLTQMGAQLREEKAHAGEQTYTV